MEPALGSWRDNDPQTWTIDQVIEEFCHNNTPIWSSPGTAEVIPNREILEQKFRENHINGDNLLALDKGTLKEDLGVTSFGQNRAVVKAIQYLRATSESYKHASFQADGVAGVQSPGYFTPQPTYPRVSLAPQSPTISASGLNRSQNARPTLSPSSVNGFGTGHINLVQQQSSKPEIPCSDPRPITHLSRPPTIQTREDPAPTVDATKGAFGALDMLQASVDAALSQNDHSATNTKAVLIPTKDKFLVQAKQKRRVAPTPITQEIEIRSKGSFLSKEMKPAQETFYVRLSSSWGPAQYLLPEDDTIDFAFESHNHQPGRSQVVAKQMKHFLQQRTLISPQNGSLLKIPYSLNRCQKPSEQYFTLFPHNGSRPVVHAAIDFPQLLKDAMGPNSVRHTPPFEPASPQPQDEPSPAEFAGHQEDEDAFGLQDLDSLLARYPVAIGDEGEPLYGDSGDEGELDEQTWKEIEEERTENQILSSAMTAAEVESTINETLADYRREWRETKLPKFQRKAYIVWMRSAKLKNRKPALDNSQYWMDRSTKRLQKQKEALLKDVWHKPADVTHQCQSLELTVYSIEEHTYLAQVLLSDEQPQRPNKTEGQQKPVSRRPLLEEGEELIESESDANDDLDEFLDDISDVGSIHHEPEDDEWNPIIPEKAKSSPAAKPKTPPEPIQDAAVSRVDLVASPVIETHDHDADVETDSDDAIATPAAKRRMLADRRTSPIKLKIEGQLTPNKKFIIPPSPNRTSPLRIPDSDSDDRDWPQEIASVYRSKGMSRFSAIDLTMSSPPDTGNNGDDTSSDMNVRTPDLNPDLDSSSNTSRRPSAISQASGSFTPVDSTLPAADDFDGIRNTHWAYIEDISDGRRALAKAVYGLGLPAVERLSKLTLEVSRHNSKGHEFLMKGFVILRGKTKPGGARGRKLRRLALLYMVYHNGQNFLDDIRPSEEQTNKAINEISPSKRKFFILLSRYLQVAMKKLSQQDKPQSGGKRKRDSLSSDDLPRDDKDQLISDDLSSDIEHIPPPSSGKRRKRAVLESQEANRQQQSDQQRIEEQERRRKAMEQRISQISKANGDTLSPVNFTEPIVYLDPHIASRVKPHQLKGIQFMWREIIEDPKQQGCILAHTMGLGKTMQVISLLVTIARCNQSEDARIREHIPSRARNGKTLILCPAALLDNWFDELAMWSPDRHILGAIYKIDSPDPQVPRLWAKNGGILLISYDRFVRMIKTARDQDDVKKRVSSSSLQKILLEEPNLVIADEAHKMKNPQSVINQTARKFKTLSRIALTGSPLNNHLEEYHTMVDWIAPGYLGNMVQFKAKYSEPISEGLYAESTEFERRRALRKLHVLKRDLDPKISRADISAIEQDMTTKTEYFITIALTDLQKEAYNTYVRYMKQTASDGGRGAQAKLWDWISILQILCNHPLCCYNKLQDRQRKLLENQATDGEEPMAETEPQIERDNPEDEGPPADVTIDTQGPMFEGMQRVLEVFDNATDLKDLTDPDLSCRTSLVRDIVKEAIAVDDKTLIFSHSIPSLNYLENMLSEMNCRYTRIDGNTKIGDRQSMTKQFNKTGHHQVFLISMKAGGLGMNLQGANRVIIFDFMYNPSWEEQAVGRAYRLGQKRPVFVYRFRAGGTFEGVMFNKAVFKTQVFSRVVDHKNPARHASKNVAEWLFPVQEAEQKEFGDHIGKDPKVLDKIIKRVDYIRNIELTETFQREDNEKLNDEDVKIAEQEFLDERLQRENPEAWHAKREALRANQAGLNLQSQRYAGYGRVQMAQSRNVYTPPYVNGSATYGSNNDSFPYPVDRCEMGVFSKPPLQTPIAEWNGVQGLGHTTDDVSPLLKRAKEMNSDQALSNGQAK